MADRALGNPLGNPLALRKANAESSVGDIVISKDPPDGKGWEDVNNISPYRVANLKPVFKILPNSAGNASREKYTKISRNGEFIATVEPVVSNPTLTVYKKGTSPGNEFQEAVGTTVNTNYSATALDISPNNELILVAASNYINSYSYNGVLTYKGGISNVAGSIATSGLKIHPSGNLVVASANQLRWATISGTTVSTFNQINGSPTGCGAVDFSSDGKYMIVGSSGGDRLTMYEVNENTQSFTKLDNSFDVLPTVSINSAIFSKDSKYIAVSAQLHPQQPIWIYEKTNNGYRKLETPVYNGTANSADMVFTPDNKYLITSVTSSNKSLVFELMDDIRPVYDFDISSFGNNPISMDEHGKYLVGSKSSLSRELNLYKITAANLLPNNGLTAWMKVK